MVERAKKTGSNLHLLYNTTFDTCIKVVLYKRCKFCPVFFALSTTEEASRSWGETFGDQKRHRLVCEKLLEK